MATVLHETTIEEVGIDNDRLARDEDDRADRTGNGRSMFTINQQNQQVRRRLHISADVRESPMTLDRALFLSRVRRNRIRK